MAEMFGHACQNPRVVFPNKKQMVQHAIPSLVAKTMDHYVVSTLDSCVTTIVFLICGCSDLNMIPLCL